MGSRFEAAETQWEGLGRCTHSNFMAKSVFESYWLQLQDNLRDFWVYYNVVIFLFFLFGFKQIIYLDFHALINFRISHRHPATYTFACCLRPSFYIFLPTSFCLPLILYFPSSHHSRCWLVSEVPHKSLFLPPVRHHPIFLSSISSGYPHHPLSNQSSLKLSRIPISGLAEVACFLWEMTHKLGELPGWLWKSQTGVHKGSWLVWLGERPDRPRLQDPFRTITDLKEAKKTYWSHGTGWVIVNSRGAGIPELQLSSLKPYCVVLYT